MGDSSTRGHPSIPSEGVRGLVGLQNLGNTCFMNACLQCLSNTAPVRDFFEESEWSKQVNKSNVMGHGGAVAQAFGELVRCLWSSTQKLSSEQMRVGGKGKRGGCLPSCCSSSSSKASAAADSWNSVVTVAPASPVHGVPQMSISPDHFKATLSQHCEMFAGYSQHDTQELLLFLLDALHEDLNRVVRKPYVEIFDFDGRHISYDSDARKSPPKEPQPATEVVAAERQWVGHLQRNQSVIVDLFQGQLRSELQCKTCGHRNVKFEAFMNLELPLISSGSGAEGARGAADYSATDIHSCLREFSKVEHLTGEHQWRCHKCKELRDATKQLTIFSLPNVLVISFKRFLVDNWGQTSGKLDVQVDFPLEGFDLSPGVSRDEHGERSVAANSDDNDPKYDLYGVANHFGGMSGGHYTAYCQNSIDKHWYEFNDSRCTRQSASKICTKNAYVLFFRKQRLQSRLGSMLEETVRVAADGTRRKGSVHAKQRQSVKKRLEDWHKPVSGDMNVDMHMDMHMEGREEGDEEEIDL